MKTQFNLHPENKPTSEKKYQYYVMDNDSGWACGPFDNDHDAWEYGYDNWDNYTVYQTIVIDSSVNY